jgi:hypothetical protein
MAQASPVERNHPRKFSDRYAPPGTAIVSRGRLGNPSIVYIIFNGDWEICLIGGSALGYTHDFLGMP